MNQGNPMSDHLPDPSVAPELFEGVLARRAVAWLIDCVIIGGITIAALLVGLVIGVVTLGLGLLALPFIIPIAILGYYAATLGSPMRATVGMQAMDIVLTPVRGTPLNGWSILVHPLLFWLTIWISWPFTILFALFTPRQQMIHDLVVGTLMLRRSPMQRFWRAGGARSA
jgi:uncharacterized RDD family membrane protein YckC